MARPEHDLSEGITIEAWMAGNKKLEKGSKDTLPSTLIESILEERPEVNASLVLANLKTRMNFKESHKWWQIKEDAIGIKRRLVGGEIETYDQKLEKERAKGKTEAASIGTGKIGNTEVVMYGMHWDFFAGSLGTVAGEKFQQAIDIALAKNYPFIGIFSSGGARQQEAVPGLKQMERMVNAIGNFREKKLPYIAILNGQVWGGISASAIPMGDIKVAIEGTDYGFAGARVIEAYSGQKVEPGEQSSEMHVRKYRTIDKTVKNQDELCEFLDQTLSILNPDHPKLTAANLPEFKAIVPSNKPKIELSEKVSLPLFGNEEEVFSVQKSERDRLYEQYESLVSDSRRIDAETLTALVFSDVVKLYDSYTLNNVLYNPAIIASLGKIGPQPFLIIGNQPSYQKVEEGNFRKIPSSPEPKDYDYMLRMLEFGARMGLPLVFFTDTLGAKPTLEAEQQAQSDSLARSLLATSRYPAFEISINIGMLGSGGGLATTPTGEYTTMLENAMAYVAEPRSGAVILYNKPNPTIDEVKDTILGAKATAKDQLDLSLIDGVLLEGKDHSELARNAYNQIATSYIELGKLSKKQLLSRRNNRIRTSKGIQIKKTK